MKTVRMRVNAFFGDDEIELCFPDNWEVAECLMAGHNKPPLSGDEMREALQNPYGTPRLSEMAKGAKEVCIVFDDLPKPTPTSDIVPFVLEELHRGLMRDRSRASRRPNGLSDRSSYSLDSPMSGL
jgi:nickel-dependent lactate racemase